RAPRGAAVSPADIVGTFRRFLEREGLAGSCGVIAVSGGPDSVALAAAAVSLREAGLLAGLHLAHFNHRLRGADSDADEAFVRELADRWRVPVVTAADDVAAVAQA